MNFYLVLALVGTLTVVGTLTSLRREHIRVEYTTGWLVAGAVLTCVSLFPGILKGIARELHLDPAVCFIAFGLLLISALVFQISHLVSRLRDENVLLAQRVAILEFQLHRAEQGHGFEEK